MNLLEKYREYLENIKAPKPYSKETINSYCNDVKMFLNYIGDKSVTDIMSDDVDMFLSENSPATAHRRFSSVKNFYKYLNRIGIADGSPIVRGETYRNLRTIPKKMSIYMFKEETFIFMNEAAKKIRDYAIMMVFINTAMRESELINLKIKDYDGKFIKYIAKGNKERIQAIGSAAAQAIDDYLATRTDDLEYLFVSNKGCKYSPSGIYTLVKTIAKRAGIKKDITPHKLRNTCAAAMRTDGNDIYTIAKKLGHEDIKVTEIYLRTLVDERDIEAAEKGSFNVDFRAKAEA